MQHGSAFEARVAIMRRARLRERGLRDALPESSSSASILRMR
jgi:hypothetical protein